MIALEPEFRKRIGDIFGDAGRRWLGDLPRILDEYAARWSLTLEAPYELSGNYVAPARRADGTRAVLKAGVLPHEVSFSIAALRHWDGDGCVRVFEHDRAAGVALIELVRPGTPIVEIDDGEATLIATRLMRRMRRPAPVDHGVPTLGEWGRAFAELRARHDGTTGPLPATIFERGESLYFDLIKSQTETIVLHGDLHHLNILRAEREPWLVIDPHGVVGDPAFEICSWMLNPAGLARRPDVAGVLARRLDVFASELGLDRQRLRDWSIAFAALSAAWSDESHHLEGCEASMALAEQLMTV